MNKECNVAGRNGLSERFGSFARPRLTVDVEKYQAMLDDSELTEEQKRQVLEDLWSIIVSFVELGFQMHPVQEVCGKDSLADVEAAKPAFDAVSLDYTKLE